ncbi:MAG: inositol monophosphatase [Candidatus Marinimicrobia bacterium]|nr:inositol monophosphatase [Candidatus Neomarinimicrobiota bacterium]
MSLEHLEIARIAAREGGKILLSKLGNAGKLDFKGKINLVTDTDRESEEVILEFLSKNSPGVHITSEENEESHGSADERWIVDPLDGTTNFTHSLPGFTVSIAYENDGVIQSGVVYDPYNKEEFTAAIGNGAKLNDEPITVSEVNKLKYALVATGFPYESEGILDIVVESVREMLTSAQGLRRLGTASLDCCYTAMGRFDLYYEFTLEPWDIAAGSLILQEAGGKITSPFGDPFDLETGNILISNGFIHEEAIEAILRAKGRAENS